MREMILCKLGEVVLKGLNRRSFEDKLIGNLRRRTAKCGNFRIYSKQSTIYVEPVNDESDLTAAYAACKQVFGVIAVSRALPCEKDVQAIIRTAKDYLAPEFARAKDFKVESKRADKTFPLTSIQLSQQVGGALHQAFPRCAVNVHDPKLTVFIEIRDDAAYVHGPAEAGAGGLPIGMGGSAVSLLSGGIDSPVASYMMAKRGVSLEMVHFFSPPYTSDAAKEKVLELAQLLTPWCGRLTVHIVPFTEIQEQIRINCPEDHFTLIMRRFMMRLAQRVADEVRAKALVTGECLGQVASQTMEALRVSEDVAELPVLRPLIGMDKEEIIRISRKIGTFDTSILPYEDCCTVFTPRHPKTKPRVEEVRELEAVLDIDALCDRAMAGRERGGFTAATDSLYVGASMILTPDKRTDMQLLETLKVFFLDIGFASLTFSDPEEHDRIIAFTSQLAHIVSSAYVKSPEAQKRRGFSAGSFQDMTRVARLDEDMWTELFLDDADYLTDELDILIGHLQEYADALKSKDAEHLRALLRDGREKKATAGGN